MNSSNYIDVLKTVESAGARAWLVGDSVCLVEMGMQPKTMTLALETDDLTKIAETLDVTVDARGPYPALRGAVNGMPFRGFKIQGETIEDDLARRDFSIEAIALRSDGGVVDPFRGRLDIRNRVLRLTGDNINLIYEDPLRIFRMLRIASVYNMSPFWLTDTEIRAFLREHTDEMKKLPQERVGREIIRGIQGRPWSFFSLCDFYNLLPLFLPELEDLKHISDGNTGVIFDHVMDMLRVIERRMDSRKIMQSQAFVLAGLFCRIGRKTLRDHDMSQTVKLTRQYLNRWNVPSEVIEEVEEIITNYRFFYTEHSEREFCEAVMKYGRDSVEATMEFAVCTAYVERRMAPELQEVLDDNRWNLAQVLRRFRSVARKMNNAGRFLSGDDIVKLLNITPGRRVGEILRALDMAVGTGQINSLEAAREWVLANNPVNPDTQDKA